MYVYIESSTGIVWSASTQEFTVEDIAASTGFPVDVRRDDATNKIIPKGSGQDYYYRWTGTEYVREWILEDLKIFKNNQIDLHTRMIISNGVLYDDHIFPLDIPDQSTWHGIFNAIEAGVITYPIKVMDKVNNPYYLADAAAFQAMYFYGFGAVSEILESGRVIKAEVNACTTKEEIDAIIDPR